MNQPTNDEGRTEGVVGNCSLNDIRCFCKAHSAFCDNIDKVIMPNEGIQITCRVHKHIMHNNMTSIIKVNCKKEFANKHADC